MLNVMTNVQLVKNTPTTVYLVMKTEIQHQTVNVVMDSMKLQKAPVKLVATDVRLVTELQITVPNVTDLEIHSMIAHAQADIMK